MHSSITVVLATLIFALVGADHAIAQTATARAWGPGCNTALLETEFSLANAPVVTSTAERGAACSVARALRGLLPRSPMFARQAIHMNFEYILGGEPLRNVLHDPSLDWDVWRAFLVDEDLAEADDLNGFRLDAQDILWLHLWVNGPDIRSTPNRRQWWINQITREMDAPSGRPVRRWLLLRLAAATDSQTPDPPARQYSRQPTPRRPFISISDAGPQPQFAEALRLLARSQHLTYEVWAIDPNTLPRTRVRFANLGERCTIIMDTVIDQESWSESGEFSGESYGAWFGAPDESFSGLMHVTLPRRDNRDGMFFFTYNACLYAWPKAEMERAAIDMARKSGFVDSTADRDLRRRGFAPLQVTLKHD